MPTQLDTYENMSALHAATPPAQQPALVTYWRRHTWGIDATYAERKTARLAVSALWRPLFAVTSPTRPLFDRWAADHGYAAKGATR